MTIEAITRTIQAILAPVVMISSCAILVGGLQTHYAAINDRLRTLARERLELLRGADGTLDVAATSGDAYKTERLAEVDWQLPRLLHRHELMHRSVLVIYAAILLFVLSMFVIALGEVQRSGAVATLALVLFLLGTTALLVSVFLVSIEVRTSNDVVQYEVRRVLEVGGTRAPEQYDAMSATSAKEQQ